MASHCFIEFGLIHLFNWDWPCLNCCMWRFHTWLAMNELKEDSTCVLKSFLSLVHSTSSADQKAASLHCKHTVLYAMITMASPEPAMFPKICPVKPFFLGCCALPLHAREAWPCQHDSFNACLKLLVALNIVKEFRCSKDTLLPSTGSVLW